jgi:DNA-binding FadR family transcriptional regulator
MRYGVAMRGLRPSRRPIDKPIYQWIAATIREKIDDGVFAPGTELPSEQELSTSFRVSRDSLRAGLAVLRREGLIDSRRGFRPRIRRQPARTPIALSPGEIAIARMPTMTERVEHEVAEGVPVIVIADQIYPADQVALTVRS